VDGWVGQPHAAWTYDESGYVTLMAWELGTQHVGRSTRIVCTDGQEITGDYAGSDQHAEAVVVHLYSRSGGRDVLHEHLLDLTAPIKVRQYRNPNARHNQ
jgi:hypothetical protein